MADDVGRRVGATPSFRRAQIGDRPSAGEHNKITEAIRQLYAQIAPYTRKIGVELVRLSQAIGPSEEELSEFHKRSAVVQYYDQDQNIFLENPDEEKQATDPMGLVWDQDEIVPALYHHQSGMYLPLNPRTVRQAITWPAAGGSYPTGVANKYPIKFVRYEYDDLGADLQTPTMVYLDSQTTSPGSSDPDDYVLNICDDVVLIPVETPLEVFNNIGQNGEQQWYTRFSVGGGSGLTVVMFEILDIYRGIGLNCNAVEARILNVSCNGTAESNPQSGSVSVSGLSSSIGGTIIVWDSLGCIFNCPMDLLIGVRGYATRMTTPEDGSSLALEQFPSGPQPERPCRWEVTTLCCVE